jgi:protein-L-isoaspartate(D-aspartate) O-methyltransferase
MFFQTIRQIGRWAVLSLAIAALNISYNRPIACAGAQDDDSTGSKTERLKSAPRRSANVQFEDSWSEARRRLVEDEIVAAGVKDARVCDAMRKTPRHEFVPAALRRYAYFDMGLPIGDGQTISSPFVVAYMTEKLEPKATDKVLEIGTGSGYQAAVLSGLVAEVYSIEIVEPLGKRAAETLKRLGYDNVKTKIGDGYQGWAEHAPFDKIIVTCSPESVPKPLVEQLKEGGRLVVPLGRRFQQTLYLFKKVEGALKAEPLQPIFFVPMVGQAEDERSQPAEPREPTLVNGDFKDASNGVPAVWYYVRQAKIEETGGAPGEKCLTFHNETPGRGAQALQAVGVDGRRTHEIEVAISARGEQLQPGTLPDQNPGLCVVFFNANRQPIGKKGIGPWTGTFNWTKSRERIKVPASARLASVEIGLWGGTGQLSVTDVHLEAVAASPKRGTSSAK